MNVIKVLTDNDLSSNEKIVLMYLYETNKGNSVTLSSKYISDQIGISRATFIKTVRGLISKGLVRKISNTDMHDTTSANTYDLKVKKYI